MKSMKPAAGIAPVESVVPVESAATPVERSGSSSSDCTDCSHCAGRSRPRTRAGVRVSIDLQQYFSDQRARAFMWAPYGRCVQWLSRRIARVFGLNDTIALMSRSHMLPMSEPLLMLEPYEPVKVINRSHMLTPHDQHGDCRTTNEISALTGRPGANIKEHPNQCNVSTKQDFNQLVISSQGNNIAEHQNISRLEHSTEEMETTIGSVESQSIDVSENLQRLKQNALRLLDEHCDALQGASAPKRMRRRRRRRRPLLETAQASASSDYEKPQHCDTVHASQDVAAAVLRNGSGSRPPRLIRALSPSPLIQEV